MSIHLHCIDNIKNHMHAGAAWPTRDGVVGDADAETWRVGSSAGEGDSEIKVLKREDRRGTIHDLYTFN